MSRRSEDNETRVMIAPRVPFEQRRRAAFLVRWSLVNIFLTTAACCLTLWIWLTEQDIRGTIARVMQRQQQGCEQRVIKGGVAQIVDPEYLAPPQDAPRNGYFGAKGTDISPAMRLKLEALREAKPTQGKLESLRLGSQDILPAGTIHVVNLWATWCAPCKEEMPDFKAMFERHPEWAPDVRFLPILVKDPNEPRKAYQDLAPLLPPSAVKLADRSYEEALVTALAPDEQLKLFHGNLPVTLVLDCNRRVRWARFEQLGEADFAELERYVDTFRAELSDKSYGAWCTQEWPGNGRCEGKENTAAHHSLEDCGELRRRPGSAAATTVEAPGALIGSGPGASASGNTSSGCPVGMIRGSEGRCIPKLRGQARPISSAGESAADRRCGDGKCEPARGESNQTCCRDCACNAPLVCRPDTHDEYRCQVKGLK